MRLLTQYIFKPIFRFLVHVVKGVVMWTFRQIGLGIRFALPQIIGLVFSGLWGAVKLVIFAVISPFRGFAWTVNEIAEHWLAEALANGFPMLWETQLRSWFRLLATLTILAGWMIMVFTAVFTLVVGFYLMF